MTVASNRDHHVLPGAAESLDMPAGTRELPSDPGHVPHDRDQAVERPGHPTGAGTRRLALIAIGLVLLLVAVGTRLAVVSSDRTSPEWSGVLVDPPRPRPSFQLSTIDGQPFDFTSQTQGRLTFLFFGYSNCPDVCPIQLSSLTGALRSNPSVAGDVVFVTTDPSRDTPERLRDWLSSFDYPITALTGTEADLRRAQEASALTPSIAGTPRADGSYEVGHAAQVILITPDDQVHLVYPFGIRREDWLNDLAELSTHDWTRQVR